MASDSSRLKPSLGLFDATAIGIGAIIGGGIFVVTGIVAGLAGPALVVSIILAGVISLFTALSFVELTTWLPREGSIYEFAGRLISPFAGFLGGWMWAVSNTFVGAAVSIGFAYYLVSLLPFWSPKLIAATICVLFMIINLVGARQSAELNNVLVSAKVAILVVFLAVGAFHLNSSNFTPFVPSETGILSGAFFIFFAFSGFARIAVVSEEVKDAVKNVPRSIILALAISGVIYILVGVVAIGLAGAGSLAASNSPLATAIGVVGNPILVYIVSAGGMLATASVLLTSILGVSRMTFAMARRRDLPSTLSRLHERFNTPYWSVLIIGAAMALLALLIDLEGVVSVSTFASLFYYALANISALRLRPEDRLYPRPLPALGLVTCILLAAFVQPSALAIGVACLASGAVYYAARHRPTTGEPSASGATRRSS